MYRCEATSIEGFVHQLAVSYFGNGYWFYVTGEIPPAKDPRAVDQKLVARYGIDISKWARARNKKAGTANLQYIRFQRFFVLLASHGQHAFFDGEAPSIRDARRTPVRFYGYSISFRGGHSHVRIEQDTYKELKAYFIDLALRRSREALKEELSQIRFEPYAPIRRQLLAILREVNGLRKVAGYDPILTPCFRFRRRICHPFEQVAGGQRRTVSRPNAVNLVEV